MTNTCQHVTNTRDRRRSYFLIYFQTTSFEGINILYKYKINFKQPFFVIQLGQKQTIKKKEEEETKKKKRLEEREEQ